MCFRYCLGTRMQASSVRASTEPELVSYLPNFWKIDLWPLFLGCRRHDAKARAFILVPNVLPRIFRTRIPLSNTYPTWGVLFVVEARDCSFLHPQIWGEITSRWQTCSIPQCVYCTSNHAPVITNIMASVRTSRAQRGVLLALHHSDKSDCCCYLYANCADI